METETREMEKNLARAWKDEHYTDDQAKLSAELQGLNFFNVTVDRSELFEEKNK